MLLMVFFIYLLLPAAAVYASIALWRRGVSAARCLRTDATHDAPATAASTTAAAATPSVAILRTALTTSARTDTSHAAR